MTDEAFTEEDAEHPRLDRFKARREMINTMIDMGVAPKTEQFVTPKGVHKSDKLKAWVNSQQQEENNELVQIGMEIHRPPGTGSIAKLLEEARARGLVNQDEAKDFQIFGTPKLDYFSESGIPKFSKHTHPIKKGTKK